MTMLDKDGKRIVVKETAEKKPAKSDKKDKK